MVRILQVVGTMDLGGAETLIMNIYRNIDRTKIQFDFLCHNRIESKYQEEIYNLGGKMYMVQGISHIGIVRYEKLLYDFFRSHPEYKVIHSHQNDLNGVILKQAKKAGIKHRYSHSHTVYVGKTFSYKLRLAIFRHYVNKYTTDPFACSKPAGEGLYNGKLQKSMIIINNGVDVDRFTFTAQYKEAVRNELCVDSNTVLIGHVGRFAVVKNHKFIVECFDKYLKLNSNAKLLLIGEGELENQVKDKCKELGIENSVIFLGARKDIYRLLSALDEFIFPSINEGIPVSLVEAQTAGLPILASDSISEMACFTELAHVLSLECSANEWAEWMKKILVIHHGEDRVKYSEKVRECGFDIRSVVGYLQEKYINDYYS